MKPMATKAKYCSKLLLAAAVFSTLIGTAPADDPKPPKFQFTVPKPDTEFKTPAPITISGTHRLGTDEHVWIFLLDIFGGYYVQNPPVALERDGKWKATNIRPSKGIHAIIAVRVDSDGHKRIRQWIEVKRFGKISEDEVSGLPGYRELARVSIVTPKPD